MANVKVYSFKVPCIIEGDFIPAKGKSTLEMIKSFKGEVIFGTEEIINESSLNSTGRYHAAAISVPSKGKGEYV